jgi:chromosome partitioning protein
MKIISFLNMKGGVGKTTISINVAYKIQSLGYSVILVDTDPQGSSRAWNEANKATVLPVIGMDRTTLPNDIKAIKDQYDFVVIDGAFKEPRLTASAISISDLVIIPLKPSQLDVNATDHIVELIESKQELNNGKPKARFLISQAVSISRVSKEVLRVVKEEYFLGVLKSNTTSRVSYIESIGDGKTVYDTQDKKAHLEIDEITIEIMELIQ